MSPDAFLRPHIEDFDTLARMYRILREAYEPGVTVDKEFTRKTAKLVQEHTHSGKIKSTLDIYEINEKTLKKLEEDGSSDTEKVFNLLRSMGLSIEKGMTSNPYLISIGEKAEIISIIYRQRQKNTKETLKELKGLIKEINEAKREQKKKRMSSEIFSIYWILKDEEIKEAEENANNMKKIFNKYPHWQTSEEHERKLKKEILKIFTKSKVSVKKSVELTNKILNILKRSTK